MASIAYYSNVADAKAQPQENAEGTMTIPFTFALSAALLITDVVNLVKIPNKATILDFFIDFPDLDTHATPLITFDVGDTVDPDRFLAASTAAQTGAKIDGLEDAIDASLPYQFSHDPTAGAVESASSAVNSGMFQLTVAAAAATAVTTGTIRGWVQYSCRTSKYIAAT